MSFEYITRIDSNKIKLQSYFKVIELLQVQKSYRLWFIMITELLKPNEFYSDIILCEGMRVDKCMFNELWDRNFTYILSLSIIPKT